MIRFNTLLEKPGAGIDPKEVKLVRHQDHRSPDGPTPYQLWLAGDGRLELYQQIQSSPVFSGPHADTITRSRHPNMRELRCQHQGRPYRILFAFDPRRVAILLIGGDKTGNSRWYDEFVPLADRIYEKYLREISH